MRIVIVGAGKVGYYLVKTLLNKGHDVSVIEMNESRCMRIAEEFGILTINGDGTDIYNLADADADNVEVVAAVTGSDEENLIVCQMAKRKFGINKTVARINNPKNELIFKELGVDIAISSTSLIANSIEMEMETVKEKALLKLNREDIDVIEFNIDEEAKSLGKMIKEFSAELQDFAILIALFRDNQFLIPKGDTVIIQNDRIIALATHGTKDRLRNVLLGKRKK